MDSGKITIMNCRFESAGPEPVLTVEDVPSGLEVLVLGERFTRPVRIGKSSMEAAARRSKVVRLGPCPDCGQMVEYHPDSSPAQHRDIDPVACIMGS